MKKYPEIMDFDALKGIYTNPNSGRDVVQSAFCKTISLNADVEYLHERGTEIIQCCKVWIMNWETVLENIRADVDKRRNEKLEATADKFKDYTPEQLEALVAAIRAKQGVADANGE